MHRRFIFLLQILLVSSQFTELYTVNTYKCYLILFTFALRWVYVAHVLPLSPFSCGLSAEAGGGCEIFVRIHKLRLDFV